MKNLSEYLTEQSAQKTTYVVGAYFDDYNGEELHAWERVNFIPGWSAPAFAKQYKNYNAADALAKKKVSKNTPTFVCPLDIFKEMVNTLKHTPQKERKDVFYNMAKENGIEINEE